MPNSPAGSKVFSDEALGSHHFKWMSIRNLLCLAFTYCSQPTFFYIFDHLSEETVTVLDFTAVAVVIGMTYMCVELFIKQYTRRLDWNQNLSPVLKGMTVALMMQSNLFCLLHMRYAGDGARYLASSFYSNPIWSVCSHHFNESRCLDSRYVLDHCVKNNLTKRLPLNLTSVHLHYTVFIDDEKDSQFQKMPEKRTSFDPNNLQKTSLGSNAGRTLTWRFFVAAVIWILNFCLTTIPISVAMKFYKYTVYLRVVSTALTAIFLAVSTDRSKEAFLDIIDINARPTISSSVSYVGLIYGVGMIGVYDFGMTSPFTMIDSVVLIFTICLIILSTVKSFIVNMLLMELSDCVVIHEGEKSWHYILFAMLPLATEFLYGQKLINVFLYLHLLLSLFPFLMLNTLTTTRLLHSEFPSIRIIYIEGLLCLLGFCLSVPILVVDKYIDNVRIGLYYGLCATTLYLGGLRMAIIMWVYGVGKFSTDINFWLGFSPTRFWTWCWTIVPALLLVSFGYEMFQMLQISSTVETVALVWTLTSVLFVFGMQTKTIVRYVMQNNLMGAFRSSKKYGPPDPRDRKRRRRYNAIIDHRDCFHDCMPVDEEVDCNHLPLMNTAEPPSNESETSLTQMYDSGPAKSTSVITIVETKYDTKGKQD